MEGSARQYLGLGARYRCCNHRCRIYSVLKEVATTSESTVITERGAVANPAPPPFDPDNDLMADIEGSKSAVEAYRREGDALRAAAVSK